MEMDPKRIAKFLTALAGAAAQLVAAGLVDGDAQQWLSLAVAILTAAAVFLVPNEVPHEASPPAGAMDGFAVENPGDH